MSVQTVNAAAARLAWVRHGRMPIASSIGRSLLSRPFPRHAAARVLLAYVDDELAYPQFEPFLRYSPRFAARGIHFRAIPVDRLNPARLPRGTDAVFLQYGYTPAPGKLEGLLGDLKRAAPGVRISYFDWFAPLDLRFAERVEPYVSAYVKKAVLREPAAYLVPTRGHTNLSDHFSAALDTDNPPPSWRVPPAILDRLTVGPAFSTGRKLIWLFEGDAPPDGVRPIDVHARIETRGLSWYAAMRRHAAGAARTAFAGLEVLSEGRVDYRQYMAELGRSKLCFSPFGYGEICWRDFEAAAMGAVLVKPDMGHLRTRPDIYRPFETYIPVAWDLSDLRERVEAALADPAGMRRMALAAFAIIREHLKGESLDRFLDRLLGLK